MLLMHLVGARPNFPKLAPVHRAAKSAALTQKIVHTGQHYDDALSGAFFRALGIPQPDIDLSVGSDSHAVQTARVMERLEPLLESSRPDWLIVYGDVNSTMAGALVASKMGIRIAHVEAGLRSNDRSMPEEINRIVTDRLASLLFTPSRDADESLRREGESADKIVFVGNVMIDSLLYALPQARLSGFVSKMGLEAKPIAVTIHRPSNVDNPERLSRIAASLAEISETRPVVFSVHPRTRERLTSVDADLRKVRMLPPIGYLEMLDLVSASHAVITDSGGLQEETTALGIPCLTLRPNTERPITILEGTNRLVPEPEHLLSALNSIKATTHLRRPEGWDGAAGERIVSALLARG